MVQCCGDIFPIRFIDFMLASKNVTDFRNLFSPSKFKEKGKTILDYFIKKN